MLHVRTTMSPYKYFKLRLCPSSSLLVERWFPFPIGSGLKALGLQLRSLPQRWLLCDRCDAANQAGRSRLEGAGRTAEFDVGPQSWRINLRSLRLCFSCRAVGNLGNRQL